MITDMQQWQQRDQQNLSEAIAIIERVPFVRAIALTGSLAENKATEQSDIDLFIQVREGTIWTTRALVTLAIESAGIRRTDAKIAGRICLNWYATFNAPKEQSGRVYKTLYSGVRSDLLEKLMEILVLWWSEPLLRAYQTHRIENDPRTHAPGSQVRYSDQELGFHPPKG
jgi:predicted nucleotidyltransferase